MKNLYRWFLSGALVALVAFAIHGCGGDDENPASPGGGGATADVTINIIADMGAGAFGAAPTTVTVGQTVSWRNTRSTDHTSTSDAGGAGSWDTNTIGPGATSAPITMSTQGSFNYHCDFHPTMTSTLIVNP
jgi:plastocyanin